ncbi:MAG TPA: hypothetical protein VK137_06695, partial [Planctomycetaceae bacterium]|nr:hypothetical protein [Planctomycetaceae bacterium]
MLTAVAVASLFVGVGLHSGLGDDVFRDPLGGKANSTRRDGGSAKGPLLTVSLNLDKASQTRNSGELFVLSIGLTYPAGSYTYSTNPEFSGATRITLAKTTTGVEPVEETFVADQEPKREFQADQTVEKFKDGRVTWSRRFRLLPGTNRDAARIVGRVKYQICNERSCTPHDESFEVGLGAPARVVFTTNARERESNTASPPSAIDTLASPSKVAGDANTIAGLQPFEIEVTPQRGESPDPIKARFRLSPDNAKPGEAVTLSVTMQLEPGWHTFALDHDPKNAGNPTTIEVTSANGLVPTEDPFTPTLAPQIELIEGGQEQRVHHKEITWTRQFTVEKREYGVSGELRYQICRMGQCRPSKKVSFALGHLALEPIAQGQSDPPLPGSEDNDVDAVPLDKLLPSFQGQQFQVEDDTVGSLGVFLLYAFLGGLILNVMPCVLPVIAIKVFSFLKQAGESRVRILTLNLVYSLGVVAVFLVLATLAVLPKFKIGWGGLFQETGFQVAMTC